jgi:nitroreductase
MNVYDLITNRRSVRRFQSKPIPKELLERCVNAARLAPSAGNLQPLEYIIVNDRRLLPEVYATLRWPTYLRPHGEPPEGQRPQAYIVILKRIKGSISESAYDIGEAIENMILVALAEGIGSCQFASVDRDKLRQVLSVPAEYEITLVLALGYPNETHVVEPFADSPKYWRDKDGVHHVPKKSLESIRHWNKF